MRVLIRRIGVEREEINIAKVKYLDISQFFIIFYELKCSKKKNEQVTWIKFLFKNFCEKKGKRKGEGRLFILISSMRKNVIEYLFKSKNID